MTLKTTLELSTNTAGDENHMTSNDIRMALRNTFKSLYAY